MYSQLEYIIYLHSGKTKNKYFKINLDVYCSEGKYQLILSAAATKKKSKFWNVLSRKTIFDLTLADNQLVLEIFGTGTYMLLVSSRGKLGDRATLLSPMKTFVQPRKLTFYYHMKLSADDRDTSLAVHQVSPLLVYERSIMFVTGKAVNRSLVQTC